jgi:hypothetical protein
MLSAVDLEGNIGMGLGFSPDTYLQGSAYGFPVIDIAVTRIGLGPKLAIEPIAQFTWVSDGVDGVYFDLSVLGNFLLRGHKKTNLYGKAGLGFLIDDRYTDTMFGFNLPFGFGIEHFASDHFSINLTALSGLTYISNPPPPAMTDSHFELKLGNEKPFAFYLLWYY